MQDEQLFTFIYGFSVTIFLLFISFINLLESKSKNLLRFSTNFEGLSVIMSKFLGWFMPYLSLKFLRYAELLMLYLTFDSIEDRILDLKYATKLSPYLFLGFGDSPILIS